MYHTSRIAGFWFLCCIQIPEPSGVTWMHPLHKYVHFYYHHLLCSLMFALQILCVTNRMLTKSCVQSSIQYVPKHVISFYFIADMLADVFLKGDTTFHAFQTLVPQVLCQRRLHCNIFCPSSTCGRLQMSTLESHRMCNKCAFCSCGCTEKPLRRVATHHEMFFFIVSVLLSFFCF